MCRQPEPIFSSDMFIKTTVVNFSATFKGLQDQLLSLVINLVRKKGQSQQGYSNLAYSTLAWNLEFALYEHFLKVEND